MKTKHAPFSLYKKKVGKRQLWYARFWDYNLKAYKVHRALGIEAIGKKERKGDAEKAAHLLLPSIGLSVPASINMIDCLKSFWEYNGRYFREAEITRGRKLSVYYSKQSLNIIRLHIETYPQFNKIGLDELTPDILRSFMIWEKERGVSGYSINRALHVMRVCAKYALSNDEIKTDPFRTIKKAYSKTKEKGVLKQEEVAQLIKNGIEEKYAKRKLMVLLGILCGMRVGEVRGLMWEDIDRKSMTLNIRHNWQDTEGLKSPKYDSFRTVPLQECIIQCIDLIPNDKSSPYVFPSAKPDKPLSNATVQRALRAELERIGISYKEQRRRVLPVHSLRHGFVSLGRLAGLNDFQIQALAGHKSSAMMDLYSHAGQVIDLNKCQAVIGNFIENI